MLAFVDQCSEMDSNKFVEGFIWFIYICSSLFSHRFTWSFLRQNCEMRFRNIDSTMIDRLTSAYHTVIAGEMLSEFLSRTGV